MDPISLDKLLSIADAMETRPSVQIPLSVLHQIVSTGSRATDPDRRTRDILRVLLGLGWLVGYGDGELELTDGFRQFVDAWDDGDLPTLNRQLATYQPYARFLSLLSQEGPFRIPRGSEEAEKGLVHRLAKAYSVTTVAFETFRTWAIAVGQAYLSPFEGILSWGGDWNDSTPDLEVFKVACWHGYRDAAKTSGYANIGCLADAVCCSLRISFQAFETSMQRLLEAKPELVRMAPATIREPSRRFQIVTIRPRSEIVQERMASRLRGEDPLPKPEWLERRYLEDGIRINGQLLKLIRWEVSA